MRNLLEGLLHLFSRRPPGDIAVDLLDILLVTYLVYRALLVIRGTRAMQMVFGLVVIAIIYVVSRWLGLVTLFNLLAGLLGSAILIVVVVFQNDIRRGLMRVGSRAFLAGLSRQQESRVVDEVVAAATELARHRTGALICFEQDANLDEFVPSPGTTIDANVQHDLLVSLFVPDQHNKLHDGAVIIRNLRIAQAGVFFPMPDTKLLDKSLGSRHRAALGITEETDAVVVVVSEERGTISFCFNGNIVSGLDGAQLRQALLGLFGQTAGKAPASPAESKKAPVSSRPSVMPPSKSRPGLGQVDSLSMRGSDVATSITFEVPPAAPRPMAPARPIGIEDLGVTPFLRSSPETEPSALPVLEPESKTGARERES
ncbi:MAG: diadenylate cyclase CdaA [Myxococcales bacterium]|jgi:uncharacterized protein (TIGR00159 family)